MYNVHNQPRSIVKRPSSRSLAFYNVFPSFALQFRNLLKFIGLSIKVISKLIQISSEVSEDALWKPASIELTQKLKQEIS